MSKKTLVVYYSLEGNTKFLAENIAEELNADILFLEPVKSINPKGFMKFFWGGMQVTMKKKPELVSSDINLQEYDRFFIGSPVWNGTFAPPLRTWFSEISLQSKKVALFCCFAGREKNTFKQMREELSGSTVLGEYGRKDPLSGEEQAEAAGVRKWAKEMDGLS